MPSLTRQQIIAWSAVGLAIILIGANYLRGQLQGSGEGETRAAVTVGLKDDRPSRIKVHVSGAVVNPGLYEMDGGDRVADALSAAGGPAPAADLGLINLAAKLADGQQVAVPDKATGQAAGAPSGGAGASTPGFPAGSGQPINLNSATEDQLQNLDGIGPKTAQKIIEYREAHGGFKSVDELMEVPGIGPSKYDQIKGQVCV